MKKIKWLQIFADSGEGAANPGENAADPGAARLMELGVPEDKIRKRAKSANVPWANHVSQTAVASQSQEQKPEQAAAAKEPEKKTEEPTAKRMSWQEIVADPEYNREMQKTMQARLRDAKSAEEAMAIMAPALEMLAQQRGMDTKKLDYHALSKAILDDDHTYEKMAMEEGIPENLVKEREQAKAQAKFATEQLRRIQDQQQEAERQRQFVAHKERLAQQAEAIKAVHPGFNLDSEMQNPVFQRLTHPSVGLSVEDAYNAIHYREIQQAIKENEARAARAAISANVQAGNNRPVENGATGQATSVPKFDYSKATPETRAAFKQFFRTEAAAGRKVYPK